jgi:KUP system potassium uptake protein
VATVGVTIAFGSSDRLAGAYGTAVATTMLLTTLLLYHAMRDVWRWPLIIALPVGVAFFCVDGVFFLANLVKIADGGWLPLTFAALLLYVMVSWRLGTDAIRAALARTPDDEVRFAVDLDSGRIARVPGTTVFLTRSLQKIPRLVIDHVHFNGSLPRHVIALSVFFEDTPRVTGTRCAVFDQIGEGLWHAVARFGFMEIPDLEAALKQARGLDPSIDLDGAIYIASRDLVVHRKNTRLRRRLRLSLFAFLYRNAAKVVDRFNLPPRNVVEIARQIEV